MFRDETPKGWRDICRKLEGGDALRPIKREQLSVEDVVKRRATSIHESFRKGLLVDRDSGNGKFLDSSEWLIVNRSVKIVESGRRLEGLQTFVAKVRSSQISDRRKKVGCLNGRRKWIYMEERDKKCLDL